MCPKFMLPLSRVPHIQCVYVTHCRHTFTIAVIISLHPAQSCLQLFLLLAYPSDTQAPRQRYWGRGAG